MGGIEAFIARAYPPRAPQNSVGPLALMAWGVVVLALVAVAVASWRVHTDRDRLRVLENLRRQHPAGVVGPPTPLSPMPPFSASTSS